MALDSTKVRAAVSGAVSVGPTTATAPASSSAAITGFADLGYISDAGVTETRERSTNEIRAWQGGALMRLLVTSGNLSYKFIMLETKLETVKLFYGVSAVVQTAPEGTFLINPTATGGRQSFVVDVVDGAELIRTYIPQGELGEVGDRVYVNSEAIGYEVTITAYPDVTLGASAKVFATALKT
jgi:hypothetical protein